MAHQKSSDKRSLDLEAFKLKMRYIFLPFLGFSMGAILFYNIIRWILDIYLGLWPLKDTVWNLILPIIISVILVLVIMRTRIRLLRFKLFNDNSANVFYLVMILALFPPISISQAYLYEAAYDIVDISNISDIKLYSKQKYFQVDNKSVNKQEVVYYFSTREIGKSSQELKIYLYFATPFYEDKDIWWGQVFTKVIDNNLNEKEKVQQIVSFTKISRQQYANQEISTADYFEKLQNSDTKHGYLEAIRLSGQQYINDPIILVSQLGALNEKVDKELAKFFRFFVIGMFICLLLILKAKVDKKAFQQFNVS
ncbi:hypothetical protein [Psychrobacter fozii]|uniref:hypothetical protein n=1 Tax=Psychrobacter fozii TaxID=198480 RepID=UPI001918E964|nr:hypothetical protein [Psychrobacter fozii]